jgi:hypothetical protein
LTSDKEASITSFFPAFPVIVVICVLKEVCQKNVCRKDYDLYLLERYLVFCPKVILHLPVGNGVMVVTGKYNPKEHVDNDIHTHC